MSEPQKPFACNIADCGMTFTNEDHLHVHTKKHDMVLTLGIEQKGAFVADQTPTPTRFIRNCEEVGLFQDLQNVNPFDEGFKRAMETKAGVLSLDGSLLTPAATDDVLHTPQMFYPITEAENSLYNQRNITISRSSSDESGAIKEYETTTISKLTNEVTTISRVIEKSDQIYHNQDLNNKETNMTFTNNVVTIQSNLIKKDFDSKVVSSSLVASKVDHSLKNAPTFTEITCKDVLLTNRSEVRPILSQQSLDYVVDSLTNETYMHEHPESTAKDINLFCNETIERDIISNNTQVKTNEDVSNIEKTGLSIDNSKKLKSVRIASKNIQDRKHIKNINIKPTIEDASNRNMNGFEVIIKLPNQKYLKMRPVEELCSPDSSNKLLTEFAKEKLRSNLEKKLGPSKPQPPIANQTVSNIITMPQNVVPSNIILPISSGTLIPVTIVNPVATTVLQTTTFGDCTVQIENNISNNFKTNKSDPKILNKHDKTRGVKRKKCPELVLKNTIIEKGRVIDKYNINFNDDNFDINTSAKRKIDNGKVKNKCKGKDNKYMYSNIDVINFDTVQDDESRIDRVGVKDKNDTDKKTERQCSLERKSAASKRYRENFKAKIESQKIENDKLKQINIKLHEENARLKSIIIEHAKKCSNGPDLAALIGGI